MFYLYMRPRRNLPQEYITSSSSLTTLMNVASRGNWSMRWEREQLRFYSCMPNMPTCLITEGEYKP